MTRLLLAIGLSTLATSASATLQGGTAQAPDLAITRVSVVDVERGRVVPNQVVLMKGNRIVAVEASGRTPLARTVRVIDGTGKFVIPGLWDMHAHMALSGRPLEVEMPLFVAHGVTGVRVMSADRPSSDPARTPGLDQHRAMQARIAAGTLTGPRLLSLGSWAVNGATGMADAMPAFYRARTTDEGRELARYFKERGFDFIKIYGELSREGYFGLAEEARRLNLPFAGHEPRQVSAIEISNAGQKSIEHSRIFLLNCFPGADSMRQGLIQRVPATTMRRRMVDEYDPRTCAEVFRTFAQNGTYITPTHGTRKMDAFADDSAYRHDDRMKYIPLGQRLRWEQDAKAMVAGDPSPRGRRSFLDFYHKGRELTLAAHRAGVPVMVGTDAGDSFIFPGSSVHDELAELVSAGFTPAEALRAATLSGATYLGLTADHGTVQAGRFADLVLLDANPLSDIGNTRRIHSVVQNGRVLDRAALDAMLAAVEAAVRPSVHAQLWTASIAGDTVLMARALAAGAVIDSLDPEGNRRPLNYAAINNRGPAVRLLLARGAPINLPNGTGFTPLHHAAEGGAMDALTILLAAGADATIKTPRGLLAVDIARARSDTAAVRILEAAARKP